ncbi:hypothetical protein LguiB_021441 [Lonicera macranthoides]
MMMLAPLILPLRFVRAPLLSDAPELKMPPMTANSSNEEMRILGAIASNGVNGSHTSCPKSGTCSSGSGLQAEREEVTQSEDIPETLIDAVLWWRQLMECVSRFFGTWLSRRRNPVELIADLISPWFLPASVCVGSPQKARL